MSAFGRKRTLDKFILIPVIRLTGNMFLFQKPYITPTSSPNLLS